MSPGRQRLPTVARLFLLGRWARHETLEVARERMGDVLLLLIAIALAYVARGASRHQTIASLQDALWFLVALAIYLLLLYVAKFRKASRTLGRCWSGFTTGEPRMPTLHLEPRVIREVTATKCVVACEDGTRLEILGGTIASGHRLGPFYNYPAGFPIGPEAPPRGHHHVYWFMKETAADGWVPVADHAFTYEPTATLKTTS